MATNLTLDEGLFNEVYLPLLYDYSHRHEVLMGSAGSGKSVFIAQKLIIRACSEKIRILACRRYGTTLRQSVFSLIKQILMEWKIINLVKVNESEMRFTFPSGSEIILLGLDSEEKLLSLNNISCVWLEEAVEVSYEIAQQIDLRMRGINENQQIIYSFNPVSEDSWLYDFCQNPPTSFTYLHTTFKDNKFLSKEYIQALEDLKDRNPEKARIYYYGLWGRDVSGLVIKNWEEADFDPIEIVKRVGSSAHRAGADLGYLDPTVVIDTLWDEQNKVIYVCSEWHGVGKTIDEIYDGILSLGLSRARIQFDSAHPREIDAFKRKGLYAVPCIKGSNSVDARIAFLQNHKIIVRKGCCPETVKALSNFSYERDRKTGKYIDGKYEHTYSHCVDALGYAYSDIYTKSKLRTLDKSILNL